MTKFLSILLLLAPLAYAEPNTSYYLGRMYINSVETGAVSKSEYLLTRTLDFENAKIHEVVTSKPGAAYVDTTNSIEFGQHQLEKLEPSTRFVETVIDSDPQVLVRHVDVYRVLDESGAQKLSEQIDIIVNRVPDYVYLLGREQIYGHL